MSRWLLLAAPFAGAGALTPGGGPAEPAWPIPEGAPSESVQRDLDGDGAPDTEARWLDRGSGWSSSAVCVRHGASGDVACRRWLETSYALTSAGQRLRVPAGDNRADALLETPPCAAAEPGRAAQGAMWRLADGDVAAQLEVAPSWLAGPPVPQESACLSLAQAATLSGGLAWDPSGAADLAAMQAEGWFVWYSASWPLYLTDAGPRDFTPDRVDSDGDLHLYQHAHALAIYDARRDRHAWILNAAAPDYDQKLDRWERLHGARLEGAEVAVTVAGFGEQRVSLGPWLAVPAE